MLTLVPLDLARPPRANFSLSIRLRGFLPKTGADSGSVRVPSGRLSGDGPSPTLVMVGIVSRGTLSMLARPLPPAPLKRLIFASWVERASFRNGCMVKTPSC
jgi:hypothetical protein